MYIRSILIGLVGLTAVGGTALACNEYSKPKVQTISVHSGDSKNKNHECTLVQTNSPKIHNPHCQSSSTSPSVSPKPKATPTPTPVVTSTPKPTPVVTPIPTPVSTPTSSQTVKSAAPVLPSVGGSGRLHP